jgi:N-sulfoglucosamine sulfohydrolase
MKKQNLCIAALMMLSLSLSMAAREKPNIVFFIADDVSQEDFGCYGHPTIKSPHAEMPAAAINHSGPIRMR